MPSSAVPLERRKGAASDIGGDRHDLHPGLMEEAIGGLLRPADRDVACPGDPGDDLINRNRRGTGLCSFFEPFCQRCCVSLFNEDRDYRRGVDEHQMSPESSSKNALSVASSLT